jgi:hypothetical protein
MNGVRSDDIRFGIDLLYFGDQSMGSLYVGLGYYSALAPLAEHGGDGWNDMLCGFVVFYIYEVAG